MTVNTIKMVRKIRDMYYSQTKYLSQEEQIKFIKENAKKMQGRIKKNLQSSTSDTI